MWGGALVLFVIFGSDELNLKFFLLSWSKIKTWQRDIQSHQRDTQQRDTHQRSHTQRRDATVATRLVQLLLRVTSQRAVSVSYVTDVENQSPTKRC